MTTKVLDKSKTQRERKIFFAPFSCGYIMSIFQLAEMMEGAEIAVNEGYETYFIYCDGNYCMENCNKNKRMMCLFCKNYIRTISAYLSPKIKIIPLSVIEPNVPDINFEYSTIEDIRKIEYKNAKIGLGALSQYISISRNLNPLIDEEFKSYFNKALSQGARYSNAVHKLLSELAPVQVCCQNTRMLYSRPVCDISKSLHIEFVAYDIPNVTGGQYTTFAPNAMVHDSKVIIDRINNKWDSDFLPKTEKIQIAEEFFIKRRNAKQAGDKIYVLNQQQDKLPENWDTQKYNIAIFNSSEDEFAAAEYDLMENNLFTSQYEGIKYIADLLKDRSDIHLYLRIHPNLTDIQYLYHKKLYEFESIYPNLTVIPPQSKISTYALMEAANKVVVFGSTMGIESAYWGKQTVLLSRVPYSLLDICHLPESKAEIYSLLTSDISPKKKDDALKFAYYLINNDNIDYKLIKFKKRPYHILGQKVLLFEYMMPTKKWRQKRLLLFNLAMKYLTLNNLKYPTKEDESYY